VSDPHPVARDPHAPAEIGKLPAHWDERRKRQGKPDASTCGADLRHALEVTLGMLRTSAHAMQHEHEGDDYMLGQGRGLILAADLIAGLIPIYEVQPGSSQER
jgi:hypothetical protein